MIVENFLFWTTFRHFKNRKVLIMSKVVKIFGQLLKNVNNFCLQKFVIFYSKYLVNSKKSSTFVLAIRP